MASRTKMKEEARARRLAEERAAAEGARRQRRMQMLGGIVLLGIAIVAVAIAVSSGGGKTGIAKTSKAQQSLINGVQSQLAGMPQSGATLGSQAARVKVTYYGDLQCPVCQDFTLHGGWPQLLQNDVKAGKVQVTYSGFETATRDQPTFQQEQIAALAAGTQNKFWQYVELFYHQQGAEGSGYVTESFLDSLARQVPGLNYNKWLQDRKNPALLAQVQSESSSALAAGVNSTPTLVFKGPKGSTAPPPGVADYKQIQQAIQQVS